ncbi:unnamed protein product [Linum tenue]|nr:unnamed protein product [Linum tenue]
MRREEADAAPEVVTGRRGGAREHPVEEHPVREQATRGGPREHF